MDKQINPSDDYRLSAEDLHRIVNEAGAANDLAWTVKDLMLAHYELDGTKEELRKAELENRKLKEKIAETETYLRRILELDSSGGMSLHMQSIARDAWIALQHPRTTAEPNIQGKK